MNLLMNFSSNLTLVIAAIALIVALFAVVQNLTLQKLRNLFFAGNKAANLEEFIIALSTKVNTLDTQADYIEKAIQELRERQQSSIQKIGVVRYNPFDDNGGNLSFSIALLDGHDNGVVITSMHGRETNRIYSKPVNAGQSEFTLTKEEQEAIRSSKTL